jgi:hypothetical protein
MAGALKASSLSQILNFYLVFEAHPEGMLTGHKGIDFTMHWMPQPGAPEPECRV